MHMKKLFSVLIVSIFVFSFSSFQWVTYAQDTGDVEPEVTATCDLNEKDQSLVLKFQEKMERMHEHAPWKVEFFSFRLSHLMDVLPEGGRVWCIVDGLNSHLVGLLDTAVEKEHGLFR